MRSLGASCADCLGSWWRCGVPTFVQDEPVGSEQGQEFSDAAYAGNIEKLQEMLGGGFDINSPDTDGFTALHRSCVTGNIDVIKFLVDKGADVNAEDSVR